MDTQLHVSQHEMHMPSTIISQQPMDTRCNHHPNVNPNIGPHHTTHRIYNDTWQVFRPNHQKQIRQLQATNRCNPYTRMENKSPCSHNLQSQRRHSQEQHWWTRKSSHSQASIKAIHENYPPYSHTTPQVLSSKQTEVRHQTNTRPYP